MAEALLTTFRRDYVRVIPIPEVSTALKLTDNWM